MMSDKIIDFKNTRLFKKKQEEEQNIPVFSHRVAAGTLTPVYDDAIEKVVSFASLKLDSLRGKKPENLSIITICGDSMFPMLWDKQKVIIDNSLQYKLSEPELKGKVVIGRIGSDYTIKQFNSDKKYFYLIPVNKNFAIIKIKRNTEDFEIVGVMVDALQGDYD